MLVLVFKVSTLTKFKILILTFKMLKFLFLFYFFVLRGGIRAEGEGKRIPSGLHGQCEPDAVLSPLTLRS